MCKIAYFLYCDSIQPILATSPPNTIYQITSPLLALTPFHIPGSYSFAMAFAISGLDAAIESSSLRVEFYNPEGGLVQSTGNIKTPIMEDEKSKFFPLDFKGIFMQMDMRNVTFETEGVYSTKVFMNDDLLGEYPVYVTQQRV